MRFPRRTLPTIVLLASVAMPTSAFAADAGKLFEEGVRLLDAGKIAEACAKLEASRKLEEAAGTLLNLGACYEQAGKRAQALATFRQAARAARNRERPDWEKVAVDHIRELTAALPTLTVHRGSTPGALEITVDGVPLPQQEWSLPQSVDPGRHTVAARGPGRKTYSSVVTVQRATTVTVPVLEDDRPISPATESSALAPRQYVGITIAGVGAAGLVLGGISTLVASGALDDAKAACPVYPTQCSPAAEEPNGRAETWSTIATWSIVTGAALVAGGALLYFWPTSRANVTVGLDGTRAVIGARF